MKTNWIPVSERLPEKSGDVLVCSVAGCIDVVHYSAKHRQFNSYDELPKSDASIFSNTVAWMPLPEPYREGGD